MRMISTGAARYCMRIMSAIRLGLSNLPKPSAVGMVGQPRIFVVVWNNGERMATIMQDHEQPSLFACRTFKHLRLTSSLDVDMDTLDGPALLVEFLDVIADWLA